MYKLFLALLVALFVFSCATSHSKIKTNRFIDPDTGIEAIETIMSFDEGDDPTLISFNQTKNPRNISWYIICKFCSTVDEKFVTADLRIDKKSNTFEIGHSFNKYDLKTANSNIFRQVDYFKINETVIADLNKCEDLELRFNCVNDTIGFIFDAEQKDAIKDWIRNITIPK